jgi:NAD(P)-dependent dehydrogenase (short-subunit alcohol dehydrogenase family)
MANIVIAGASGGIGQALVRRLLADSLNRVWALARSPDKLEAAGKEEAERLQVLRWDVTDPSSLTSVLNEGLPADMQIDGVIYTVGILHGEGLKPEKRLEDLQVDALQHAFAVNAIAFPVLVRELLPWLRHKDPKRIMAVSAKVGSLTDNGMGGWYAYRASKAALNMFVRNLSVELPRRIKPVTCVAVHPGTTKTALSAPFEQSLAQLEVHDPDDTARNLQAIFDRLEADHNGQFLSWDGSQLPW